MKGIIRILYISHLMHVDEHIPYFHFLLFHSTCFFLVGYAIPCESTSGGVKVTYIFIMFTYTKLKLLYVLGGVLLPCYKES